MTIKENDIIEIGNSRTSVMVRRHLASFFKHNTWAKFKNLGSIYYHYWRRKTIINGHPFEIIVDPTNICNLKCPLCVTGQHKNSRPLGKMEFDDFTKVINTLSKWLYKVRFYSWGEPLLHKDIFRMIAFTSSQNIGTELSTNFINFGEEKVKELLDSGLELLIISLDGATEETYLKYRYGGDFNKIIDNIRFLIAGKKTNKSQFPIVEVQFLVTKQNEHEVELMKELARELEVDRLRFGPLVVNTRDREQVKQWLPENENSSRYEYNTYGDKISTGQKPCIWLWRSTIVNWDCTISPCCVFEGVKTNFGSLKEQSFEEIWNNETYQAARQVFSGKGKKSRPTICLKCKGAPRADNDQQQGLY